MRRWDYGASIKFAKEEAMIEGMEKGRTTGLVEGRVEGFIETAKSMLKEGFEPELVARITKLPIAQVMKLSF